MLTSVDLDNRGDVLKVLIQSFSTAAVGLNCWSVEHYLPWAER